MSTFFTTDDGEIVLRASSQPNSKYDFRVHKFILSLASPVFKDMFTFPQHPTRPWTNNTVSPLSRLRIPQKFWTRFCDSFIRRR